MATHLVTFNHCKFYGRPSNMFSVIKVMKEDILVYNICSIYCRIKGKKCNNVQLNIL